MTPSIEEYAASGFGTKGVVRHLHNPAGAPGSHGTSTHLAPSSRGFVCVGSVRNLDYQGSPNVVCCLHYDASGRLEHKVLVVPLAGPVSAVLGAAAVPGTGWTMIWGTARPRGAPSVLPFLMKVDALGGVVDREYERRFREWTVANPGFGILSLTAHPDGSLSVGGSALSSSAHADPFAVWVDPGGVPRRTLYRGSTKHSATFVALTSLAVGSDRLAAVVWNTAGPKLGAVWFLDGHGGRLRRGRGTAQPVERIMHCAREVSGSVLAVGYDIAADGTRARALRCTSDGDVDLLVPGACAPGGALNKVRTLGTGYALIAGTMDGHPMVTCVDPAGGLDSAFAANEFVADHIAGSGTAVCKVSDNTAVLNVTTVGQGFLMLGFPLSAGAAGQAPKKQAALQPRSDNPYLGRTPESIAAEATAAHFQRMEDSRFSMAIWAKRRGSL